MEKEIDNQEETEIAIDNSSNELFSLLTETYSKPLSKKALSYIPSFFTTASLPFKNLKKSEFVRKGSNGITLTLNSPTNVPFGKYGRLLLSVYTTHAVCAKDKNAPVVVEYDSLSQLLKEMQLPRQRGQDILEQIECFTKATFSFEQRIEEQQQAYLFKDLYNRDEKIPKKDILVRTVSTGTILFTDGVQYQEIVDSEQKSPHVGRFKIILSANFAAFCQKHGVPIDYTVYKEISSPVGKDIYAWLVYRNNGMDPKKPVFIPRDRLVEQFMPINEGADQKTVNVNYSRIIDQIKLIKQKYYPDLKVEIDKDGLGIRLFKSPTPVIRDDVRYALITSDI